MRDIDACELAFRNGYEKAKLEIVHCKDCENRCTGNYKSGSVNRFKYCYEFNIAVEDDDFCSWGKERSETKCM